MGEKRSCESQLRESDEEVGGHRAHVRPLRDPPPSWDDSEAKGKQRRNRDRCQYEGRPDQRIGERKGPSGKQCENRRRRGERAPQIVDDLPFADQGSGRSRSVTARIFCVPENPGQQLPIAARPAVLARRGDLVMPRELFEELDVTRESGSGEQPLEEIVTEERILGDAPGE